MLSDGEKDLSQLSRKEIIDLAYEELVDKISKMTPNQIIEINTNAIS